MKLSVVIPVYNVAPWLERCVDSVLRQTFKDLEIILVESGTSSDGSGELCRRLAGENPLISTVHQPLPGLANARNAGIHNSQGEYIIFLDGDDYWLLDDGLETLFSYITPETDLVVFKTVDIWGQTRMVHTADYDLEKISSLSNASAVFDYLVMTQHFNMSACVNVIRREMLVDNDIFFPAGLSSEDVFWSIHLWQHVSVFRFTNLDFYGYCHREGSLTTVPSIRVYESYERIFSYWKDSCYNGCVNAEPIMAYLADMWASRGYGYGMMDKKDKPAALAVLRRHADLLNHAATHKSRRAAVLVKLFGVKAAVQTLGNYWKLRQIVKSHAV